MLNDDLTHPASDRFADSELEEDKSFPEEEK